MSLSKLPPHWAVYAPKISMKAKSIGMGLMRLCGLNTVSAEVLALLPIGMANILGEAGWRVK